MKRHGKEHTKSEKENFLTGDKVILYGWKLKNKCNSHKEMYHISNTREIN